MLCIGLCIVGLTACEKGGSTVKNYNSFMISCDKDFVYAPQPGSVATANLSATVDGETVKAAENPDASEYVTWSVESTAAGVSIDQNGAVTITNEFLYGDINGNDIIVKGTVFADGAEKCAKNYTLHVRQPEEVGMFDIVFPDYVVNGKSEKIAIANIVNQYGEPYGVANAVPGFEFSNKGIEADGDTVSVNLKLIKYLAAAVKVTVGNLTLEKRFYVHEEGYTMEPSAITALLDGDSPFDVEPKIYDIARDLDESKYYFSDTLDGVKTVTVDVSQMANYQTGALYQVSLKTTDGSVKTFDMAENNGKITVDTQNCTAIEVSPVFRFVFGKQKNAVPASDINLLATYEYDGVNLYGFCGSADSQTGSVHLKGSDPCFVIALPNGYYDVNLVKGGTGRTLVLVNGGALGCNVGIGGSGGRRGTTPYEYFMEDVKVTNGSLRINLGEKDWDIAGLEVRRSTLLEPRKTHLYLAGDSTASAYYPIETEEPENGRFQTGWGQVLNQYISSKTAITNLGSGGTYAKSWYEIAFKGVLTHAEPGDYFIIMEGINDQSYSNVDEMVEYLSKMIDECRERGIIPVLCTAMQSAKFWKDDKGNELTEFECPLGSGKASFMQGIRKLASEKQVFLIDVGDITSKQYGTLGRTYVAHNFHIYNANTDVEEDTLHLSYFGAKNVAGIIATGLYELQASGKEDGLYKTVRGIDFNNLVTEEFTYIDASGNEAVYRTDRIEAVYRTYGVRE